MTKKNNKFSLYILQIGLLLLIFATFIPGMLHANGMLFTEEESRVWGYAYTLFGVDWSYYISTESLYSFGYSILMAPVIALFQNSPVAVYKIAIMGNGLALGLSYLLSLYVMFRIFPKSNKYLISVACAVSALSPGYAAIKCLALPDMVIVLLVWINLALLISLKEHATKAKVFLFGIVCGIGVSFHAAMIVIAIIGGIQLALFAKKKQIQKKDALMGIFFIVLIVFVVQIIENIWLFAATVGLEARVSTSLGGFFAQIAEGLTHSGLLEFIGSFFSKLYGLGVGTWLLAIPGIIFCLKKGKRCSCEEAMSVGGPVAIGLLMGWYEGANANVTSVLDARCLIMVAGPITVMGIMHLLEATKWRELLVISIGSFILLTIHTSLQMQAYGEAEGLAYYSGIFSGLLDNVEVQSLRPYIITALIILTILLIFVLIRIRWKRPKVFRILRGGCLVLMLTGLYVLNDFIVQEDIVKADEELSNESERLLALLKETSENIPIYYLKEGKDQDEDIARLQYRLGMTQLLPAQMGGALLNKKEEENLENYYHNRMENQAYYAILSANSVKLRDFESNYRTLEATDEYRVFTGKNSDAERVAENVMAANIYEWKGERINLSPGTYECSIYYRINKKGPDGLGNGAVLAGGKILNTAAVSEDSNVLHITFTSDTMLKNVSFQISSPGSSNVSIESVIYRKSSTRYSFGVNKGFLSQQLLQMIRTIDEAAGEKGSIQVIVDEVIGDKFNSIEALQNECPEYEIDTLSQGEEAKGEYLLSTMESRSFFEYMEEYTIIAKNDAYVLMLSNYSDKLRYVEKAGGAVLSDGRYLDIRGYLEKKEGEYQYDSPISLESGNYNYIVRIQCNENLEEKNNTEIAKVVLSNKGKIVSEASVMTEDFQNESEITLKLPINSSEDLKRLTCKIQHEGNVSLNIRPVAIEMVSDRYQLGSDDEEAIESLMSLADRMSSTADIYFVTSTNVYEREHFSLDKLREEYSGHTFIHAVQSQVRYDKSDCLLLLEDFDSRYMGLTENYTMVAQEGDYSLWVSSYGQLKNTAIEQGITMLSVQGRMPVSLFQEEGTDSNKLGKLREGKYQLKVEVIKDEDDAASGTLQFIARKDEEIIEEEIDEKMDEMLLKGEVTESDRADARVRNIVRDSLTTESMVALHDVSSAVFEEGNRVIVTVNFTLESDIEELEMNCYNYGNGKMKAAMQWIEKTG